MTSLSEQDLPTVPEWVRFGIPRDAHHAAFEAWLHAPSGCRLLRLWYADPYLCIGGAWVYEVRHPDGRRRDAWVAAVQYPTDEAAVLQSAAAVVGELTGAVDRER